VALKITVLPGHSDSMFDEHRALRAQIVDHELLCRLRAHVNRRAVDFERAFDENLDRGSTPAQSPGFGKQDLMAIPVTIEGNGLYSARAKRHVPASGPVRFPA